MLAWNARSRVCALSIALLLSACGGGGDGDGTATPPPQRGGGGNTTPPPPGTTTAAILDRGRTLALAAAVIAELDLAATPAERPYLPDIIARGRSVVANVEDPCPGGGGIDERQNLGADLTGTIEIVFNDCVQGGARQSGALNVRIDEFDVANNVATAFVLDFENLTFAVDQFSAQADGTAAVKVEGALETLTLNLVGRYLPDDVSMRLDDVVITETTEGSGARRVAITGRAFHAEHGYVDISTLEELVFPNAPAAEPSSGAIRLTGAQNATADLSFDGRRVRVSLDADANGRVDAGLAATWLELRDTQNFAPAANAGPDATIEEGSMVTADASSSADWEDDPLTYEWTVASRPAGSAASISSSSSSLTFRPDVPGAYDVQVTVRDGSGGSSDGVRITVLPRGTLPPNRRPIANAGLDQVTVEGQSVTIDGSLTTDPENDPISYAWQLTRAPMGSTVTVNATSTTFDFTPDLPGNYDLRLTADDGRGNDSDVMRVVADRLVTFASGAHFFIHGQSLRGDDTAELGLRTSPHYRGLPVAIAASSNASWLTVTTPSVMTAAPGTATTIRVQLNLEEVKKLRNGWYEAQVTAVPAGSQRVATADVTLLLRVPRVGSVVPYVAYAGSASHATLYGEELLQANALSLFINGIEVLGAAAASDDRATVQLPPLPVGTYTVRIADALGVSPESGHVLVRNAPVYADAQLSLPGPVLSMEYDAERDSFYGVYETSPGVSVAARLHRPGDGAWQLDPIGIPAPSAVGLTADGAQLLVTSENCTIFRLDPSTLAVLQAFTKSTCDPVLERFGAVAALADGRVFVIDDELNSNVWQYPDFTRAEALPAMQYPLAVLNYERNRLLWAESLANPEPRAIYLLEVGATDARRIDTQGSSIFSDSSLAMSGNGSRTLHQARVYDEALRFMGPLDGRDLEAEIVPALNRAGTRAVALDVQDNALFVHDVSAAGPGFPQIAGGIPLHSDVTSASRVIVPPAGTAAFVFTVNQWIPGFDPDPFKLYVRVLPGI